ncbi:unnamed protein product [Parnassius apollo]|uniref:(apollo) hypothetical protein n=1 Tax=Parnassius apollo TaxID=110799 RepID=A0A8S3XHV6_PARAO|nr:unnamed protein product [Parnassius apollo]
MKSVACFVLLAIISVALCDTVPHSRGCIYIMGRCYRECEEGTQAYALGCGYLTKEATCKEPNPQPDTRGKICDFSACYCAPPTVRDPVTKKCVPLEECTREE